MKFIITIFVISIVLLGCTDDNNPFDHSSKPKFLLLKRTTIENESYSRTYEYTYINDKLKLQTSDYYSKLSNSYTSGKLEYEYINENEYYLYSYSEDNILQGVYRRFKPNSNTIRRETLDPLSRELKGYYLFNIDNTCGSTNFYRYDNNDVLIERSITEYYDSNCSFNRFYYDSNGNLKNKTQYVKDNKKSSWSDYFINFWKIDKKNIHNTVEFKSWDNNNILTSSTKSTFEYNKDNYPVFEERVSLGGDITTYYYEYY